MNSKGSMLSALGVLCVSIAVCLYLTFSYTAMWKEDLIISGPGVSEVKRLSTYYTPLKGTVADTRVFILESGKPGATIAILGGHHADEPSGWLAAMLLVERAKPETGRLIVIPQSNQSGFTHNAPQEAHTQFLHFKTPDGSIRKFRHGARPANSVDFWPDPEVFVQYPSGQNLSGEEVRNLNRSYPGREDGTFTERVAYAIRQVMLSEKVDMVVDLHEAQPEYPFVNAVGAHERAQNVSISASLALQMQDIALGVEASPQRFRGLTYRELGDTTQALALLMETANPNQGKIRGITDEKLVIEGRDAFYVEAVKFGNLFVPFDEKGWPIEVRVGRHLAAIVELAVALGEEFPEKVFTVTQDSIPSYTEITKNGVGHYLNKPPATVN